MRPDEAIQEAKFLRKMKKRRVVWDLVYPLGTPGTPGVIRSGALCPLEVVAGGCSPGVFGVDGLNFTAASAGITSTLACRIINASDGARVFRVDRRGVLRPTPKPPKALLKSDERRLRAGLFMVAGLEEAMEGRPVRPY